MEASDLRSWLISKPRPSLVRFSSSSGETGQVEITDHTKWIEIAGTICAIDPDLVEAIDAKGAVIRAVRADDLPTSSASSTSSSSSSSEGETIEIHDAESQRLVIFARLIAEAYKHSTEIAFDKLGALFDSTTKRAESLEKTVQALLRRRPVLDDQAEEPETFEQTMMQALLQGKLQGEVEKLARQKVNGAIKHAPEESEP
jgi:hypothetical protein